MGVIWRRAAIGVAAAAGLVTVTVAGLIGYTRLSGNLHEVVAGEFYRAGQPSGRQLAQWIEAYRFRSIVNLRGANPGRSWYDTEVAVATAGGVQHIDFRMKASKILSSEEAWQLIRLLRDAPKPVLVHCEAGADRTGLAAALYMAAVRNSDEATAERQLSYVFGHLSVWPAAGRRMSESFEDLEPELGYSGS